MRTFDVYTDGSTKNNGKQESYGGYAYVITHDNHYILSSSGAHVNTTNQQMELQAALSALNLIINCLKLNVFFYDDDIFYIYSDSAYLINCVNEKWYKNWIKNGWKTTSKKPVANKELWSQLIPYFENPNIKWKKCKGHSGNKWNEYVDTYAQKAADRLKEKKIK